jgi:tRNA U38,U39,U40 pseudouridine synthase TruA
MTTDAEKTRWRCTCAYDGTAFAGWQSQVGGVAIQDAIEARLAAIFHAPVRIHGSGRTDAGVHAHGQVFHFEACLRAFKSRTRAASPGNSTPVSAPRVSATFIISTSAIRIRSRVRFAGPSTVRLISPRWNARRRSCAAGMISGRSRP